MSRDELSAVLAVLALAAMSVWAMMNN